MTPLGSPLVVFSDLALCDGRQHEVRLITDGTRAYSYSEGHDLRLARRTGTQIIVSCRVPDSGDEECHGEATFALDTPGVWIVGTEGDGPEALALLDAHGEAIDR